MALRRAVLTFLKDISPYWKAIMGFLAPAAVMLTSAVQDNSAGKSSITTGEWVTAACAAVITAGAVYQAPWRPKQSLEVVSPPEN